MKRFLVTGVCLLLLTGCAAFPFHGSREVSGVQTADALSETWPADAERFASQAALELSRRYPASQTGLSLVTVPGQFGTSLENQLRGHGFAIFPSDSSSGLRIGYVLDEIIGELTPTGYLQIRTSDGMAFSMIRKLMGGLPSTASQAPALPAPVSTPEEPAQGTPVVTPPARTPDPDPVPAVKEASLAEAPQTPVPQTHTAHKEEPSKASGDSRMMPIITAVRTVIPVKWQYRIQGTELRQKQVPYPKNVPWRRAIMDMATATDSTVDINAKARLVTFMPKGMSSAPALANSTAPSLPKSPVVATALADAAHQSPLRPRQIRLKHRQRRKLRPRPSRPLQPSPSSPSLSPFPNGDSPKGVCARSWMSGQAAHRISSSGTRIRISTCSPAQRSGATSLPPLLSFLKACMPPDSRSGQRSIPQTTSWK